MTGGRPWRGAGPADVLVLDVAVLGEAECRRRALASWKPGAAVHALPDGRWALRLPTAVHLRAELAPGVPLVLAPGGVLHWTLHAHPCSAPIDDLPRVDTADWIDLSGLPVEHLVAIEGPAPEPVAVPDVSAPEPSVDLAARARVRRGRRADTVAAELAQRTAEQRRRGAARAVAGAGGGSGRGSDLLARLVLRAPGGGLVQRRHARYVASLARDLEAGRYDEALRRAIALGGGVGGLRLRLPATRQGPLRPRTAPQPGGGSVAVTAGTVEAALGRHYQVAAERLERDGRIDEAAYVLADLLDRPAEAVQMLERRGNLALAAELAEARLPTPGVAIRLWWKLGERHRAVGIARRHGAFGHVAALLGPGEDLGWRREWLRYCHDLGDPFGAVRAAWPQPSLRDEVQGALALAMSLGGPDAAEMFALAVSHRPTEPAVAIAIGLLEAPGDVAQHDGRRQLVETLATWPASDAVADRRLATAATRLLVREPEVVADIPDAPRKTLVDGLRRRADPLAVADLARRGPVRRTPATQARPYVLTGRGDLPVLDAASVRTGVLVAHGGSGTRLYGPAGQVRAQWDVPADRLVVADHGAVALLVVRGERSSELHHLDLATRRVRPWAVVAVRRLVGTYDGGSLVVVDDSGLCSWDTTGDAPRVLWRQRLARGEHVLDLARSPSSLSATIRADGSGELQPGVHLWRWSLPDGLLRARAVLSLGVDPIESAALLADGVLLTTERHGGVPYLHRYRGLGEPAREALADQGATLVGSGTGAAFLTPTADGMLVASDSRAPHGGWSVVAPGAGAVLVRQDARAVVVSSDDGRVIAFDPSSRRVEAQFAAGARGGAARSAHQAVLVLG